jgi:hypothetical protein
MAFRGWERVRLDKGDGRTVEAEAPVIVSASRATDIPAFYAPWFMERLRAGYASVDRRFRSGERCVSFINTKAVIFWSKNPRPLLPFLDEIEGMGITAMIQFTLNDYVAEGLEPGLPPLDERLETFRLLAGRLGPGRVVWRFDPLLLTGTLEVGHLLDRISHLAGSLRGCTRKLVFSFAGIGRYRKVDLRLRRLGCGAREFSPGERRRFASGLVELNREWGLSLATCAEEAVLDGISPNRCVDGSTLDTFLAGASLLDSFPGGCPDLFGEKPSWDSLKDKGQRKSCGCHASLDIGSYGTCPHLCAYCYANGPERLVLRRTGTHDPASDRLVP